MFKSGFNILTETDSFEKLNLIEPWKSEQSTKQIENPIEDTSQPEKARFSTGLSSTKLSSCEIWHRYGFLVGSKLRQTSDIISDRESRFGIETFILAYFLKSNSQKGKSKVQERAVDVKSDSPGKVLISKVIPAKYTVANRCPLNWPFHHKPGNRWILSNIHYNVWNIIIWNCAFYIFYMLLLSLAPVTRVRRTWSWGLRLGSKH